MKLESVSADLLVHLWRALLQKISPQSCRLRLQGSPKCSVGQHITSYVCTRPHGDGGAVGNAVTDDLGCDRSNKPIEFGLLASLSSLSLFLCRLCA